MSYSAFTHPTTLRRKTASSALTWGIGAALFAGFAGGAQAQQPLPSGGVVTSGSATVSSMGPTTTVDQTSSRAIVNWNSFDVGAGNSVVFHQPDANSATLNRVTGATSSTIAGQITANGAVYLVNSNGIAITSTGSVQTGGGFIASTLDITDSDFNAGKLAFTGNGASKGVRNAGSITAGAGGYVALLGGTVSNSGTISVPLGKVALGSGEQLTLDFNGDGFLQVAAPSEVEGTLIASSGRIVSSGGRIELKAASARDAVRSVVNMSGSLSADSAVGDGGAIVLFSDGGTVTVSGTLSARATGAVGNGGFVETSGKTVDFTGVRVDTSAAHGATGTWLVDPTDLTVDAAAASTIATNLETSNVTLQTTSTTATGSGVQSSGNGDIIMDSAITWTSANTLSLLAYNNIALNAAITGSNGGLTLTAGDGVANTGAISATGAIDVGLFNLTNGNFGQIAATLPTFHAADFRFTIGSANFLRVTGGDGTVGTPYTITDVYGLQGIASANALTSRFLLVNGIDASGTAAWNAGLGFVPIGTDGAGNIQNGGLGFNASFNGGNFTIAGLTINRPAAKYVGLFGFVGSIFQYDASVSISNIGLVGGTISGSTYVGSLVGSVSNAAISKAYATSAVFAVNGYVGGLIGRSVGGATSDVYATGAVSSTGTRTGGLIGYKFNGTISGAYATGAVSSTGSFTGGLIGYFNSGSVSDVYATGSVSGTVNVGGLVGYSRSSLSSAYATGAVSGTDLVGGLVGSGTSDVTNSYWDSYSTGQSQAFGAGTIDASVTAVTSDPAQSGAANYAYKAGAYANLTAASGIGTATPTGFVFLAGNGARPFLAFEVPTSALLTTDTNGRLVLTNSHQLQLIDYDGTRLASGYSLGANIDLAETGAVVAGTPGSYAGMWAASGFTPLGGDGTGNVWNGASFGSVASGAIGFSGSLDGTGYSLTNLSIKRPTITNVGLFALVSGALSNLTVSGTVSGMSGVGGLAGMVHGGSVAGSTSSVNVTGAATLVGGLVGNLNSSGSITNSSSSGTITGTNDVGGLVGYAAAATITASSSSATVNGSKYVGGLVGYQSNTTTRTSSASGNVTGDPATSGGLVGALDGGHVVSGSSTGKVNGSSGAGPKVGRTTNGGTAS